MRDGKEVTSMDTVAEMLDADFFQAKIGDGPFLIRQHEQTFLMNVARVGAWTRR